MVEVRENTPQPILAPCDSKLKSNCRAQNNAQLEPSVEVRPNWLRVEHSCQQCALSLNVVDTSYARHQVRDLKLMPAREIIVIRGGRSHDTGLVHSSLWKK